MKITDPSLLEPYNAYMQQTNTDYNAGDYAHAALLARQAWDLIPAPKEQYEESYYVAKKLYRYHLLLGQPEVAHDWAKTLLHCDLERFPDGEREFFYGKVNYELNRLDVAKEYLSIANKKSKGRCFLGEDDKYKALLKG